MTTIILTIIGILLAAAAALMVIFYGGDAFNSGTTGAAANSLQNAGTNVISAISIYRGEKGSVTGLDLNGLTSATCTAGGACLKEQPTVPQTVAGAGNAPVQTVAGGQYTVTNVDRLVCARINTNLRIGTAPTAVNTTAKMGCALPTTGNGTFFTNA